MRIALITLASLAIISSAFGVYLMYGTGGLSDTDPLFGLAILATLAAFALGLATLLVGVIAAAQRRQVAWLIAQIIAAVVAIAAPTVAGVIVQAAVILPQSLPACQNALHTAPQCQPSATQQLLLNLPGMLGTAGPLLVGLVTLIYAFRLRPAAAPISVAPS